MMMFRVNVSKVATPRLEISDNSAKDCSCFFAPQGLAFPHRHISDFDRCQQFSWILIIFVCYRNPNKPFAKAHEAYHAIRQS